MDKEEMNLTKRQLNILHEVVDRESVLAREIPRMWAVSPVLGQLFKKELIARRRYGLSRWIYYPNERGKNRLKQELLK